MLKSFSNKKVIAHFNCLKIIINHTCFREMDVILEGLNGQEDVAKLVHQWYKRDENAMPPEYVLQPISSGIPAYERETG